MAVAFGTSQSAPDTGTSTATMPASVAAGDLLLIWFHLDDNSGTASASGWTSAGTPLIWNTNSRTIGALWKIAAGGETTVAVTMTTPYRELWTERYTGTHATTPINAYGTASTTTAPDITTTVDNCMSVVTESFDGGSSNAAAPGSWVRRLNGTGGYNLYSAELLRGAAGATGTQSFAGTGSGAVGLIHLAIAPAAAAAAYVRPVLISTTQAVPRASRW